MRTPFTTLPTLVLLFAALGCSREAAPAAGRPGGEAPATSAQAPKPGSVGRAQVAPVQPLQKTKFGAAISESTATPLPALISEPSRFADKTVRTEGIVTAVCQSMGCWMEIGDE